MWRFVGRGGARQCRRVQLAEASDRSEARAGTHYVAKVRLCHSRSGRQRRYACLGQNECKARLAVAVSLCTALSSARKYLWRRGQTGGSIACREYYAETRRFSSFNLLWGTLCPLYCALEISIRGISAVRRSVQSGFASQKCRVAFFLI